MTTGTKTKFDLSSHASDKGTEDERRERIKSVEGAVLLLIEVAVPVLVLGLVVLSALFSLCG